MVGALVEQRGVDLRWRQVDKMRLPQKLDNALPEMLLRIGSRLVNPVLISSCGEGLMGGRDEIRI